MAAEPAGGGCGSGAASAVRARGAGRGARCEDGGRGLGFAPCGRRRDDALRSDRGPAVSITDAGRPLPSVERCGLGGGTEGLRPRPARPAGSPQTRPGGSLGVFHRLPASGLSCPGDAEQEGRCRVSVPLEDREVWRSQWSRSPAAGGSWSRTALSPRSSGTVSPPSRSTGACRMQDGPRPTFPILVLRPLGPCRPLGPLVGRAVGPPGSGLRLTSCHRTYVAGGGNWASPFSAAGMTA